MYKLETSPLTTSGILKNAWEFYKACFKYVLPWSFIISIVHIIPYLYRFVEFYHINNAGKLVFSWVGLLIYVAFLVVESYFLAVLIYTMHLVATEQKVDFKAVFSLAKDQLINLYFSILLYFFVVNLGIFLWILPGVFVAILFSMFVPFIVIERQSVIHAFDSSTRLVWGHWWQTFFVLCLPYLLSYLLRNFMRFSALSDHSGIWLGDLVILIFFIPYFYAIILVQYHNLKLLKSLPVPLSDRHRMQS